MRILISLMILTLQIAFNGSILPVKSEPQSKASTDTNEILNCTVCIDQELCGQKIGSATGFFYHSLEKKFLVTNKHVCTGAGIKPDKLKIRVKGVKEPIEIVLESSNKPNWFEHLHKKNVDLAVIPLSDQEVKLGAIFWLSNNFFPPSNLLISPGDGVLILGYPLGEYDVVNNLPIIRGGIIASAYGVPYKGNPFCLVDSNLLPGNSGSPIFLSPKQVWNYKNGDMSIPGGTPNYYLIGIHSFSLQGQAGQLSPGLGSCWYPNLIEEIIRTIK